MCVCNKNYHALTTIMSEKPLNKKDDLQQDVGDAADNSEIIVDEIGDTWCSWDLGARKTRERKQTAQTSTRN